MGNNLNDLHSQFKKIQKYINKIGIICILLNKMLCDTYFEFKYAVRMKLIKALSKNQKKNISFVLFLL